MFRGGQAFLSLVLLVGATIGLIGMMLIFFANSFVDTGYGYRALAQAEAVAGAGAQDALLQLARNVNFSNTGGYAVAVGSSTATVTVTQNSPSAGLVTILSTAVVSSRIRKINVVAAVNASTSQVTVNSWNLVQ